MKWIPYLLVMFLFCVSCESNRSNTAKSTTQATTEASNQTTSGSSTTLNDDQWCVDESNDVPFKNIAASCIESKANCLACRATWTALGYAEAQCNILAAAANSKVFYAGKLPTFNCLN